MHAKSTSITLGFCLAAALFREKQYIIIVSDTEGQAIEFLKDIKMELETNETLRDLFQVNGFVKDAASEVVCDIGDDHHLFRIIAKGSGQKIRGTKWHHLRPDLIIGDDLENDEIVLNQERRDKFRRWLFNVLIPCLSRSGHIRIVGTILHFDSTLERLMPQADVERGIELITTPLADFTNEEYPVWKSVRYRAHDPDYSHILWPEQFSKRDLQDIEAGYRQQGFPEGYAQEYLNYPIDEGTAYFRRQDLIPMTDDDWKKSMVYYVGVDWAASRKQRADYTVISVVGQDPEGYSHVVDLRRGRWDSLEIIEEIFSVAQRYKPDAFFFENGQIWLSIEPVLLQQMRQRGYFFDYSVVKTADDKEVRARPLQFRVRTGSLKFDKEAPWYDKLEEELARFPKGAHDDQVDSLAHIFLELQNLEDAPTWNERAEMAREEELEAISEHMEEWETSVNWITGY